MNRRHFLVSASAAASQSWAQANDHVRVAIVGVGSRGSAHIKEILPVKNMEVAALVDPDGRRTEAAAAAVFKATGKQPKLESDMRRVFDDKNIDAVTIATTNHWHSLTAMSDINKPRPNAAPSFEHMPRLTMLSSPSSRLIPPLNAWNFMKITSPFPTHCKNWT